MVEKTPKPTPMMEQYLSIKAKYEYCLLFYRLGDFYELFFDDAKIASAELDLTLTGKDCGMAERAPMCGVPFHAADGYIAKLIEKGYKVAICEQTEDPKKAKGIVKREVIRIVTPGTVLDTNVLDEGKNNYIMSIYQGSNGFGVASCDVSTGEFTVTEISDENENKVIDELARVMPSEIICNESLNLKNRIENIFNTKPADYNGWAFDYQNAFISLCNHFQTLNLSGFGIEGDKLCVPAAGALMSYLLETQKNNLSHISSIRKIEKNKYMVLDISSRRNLELTQTIREKTKKGSLLWVLDKTKTAMGARLLRSRIEQPLINIEKINIRLDGVESFKENVMAREELRELISGIYDIERLMSKVVYSTANARDLIALKQSFAILPHLKYMLSEFDCEATRRMQNSLDTLEDLCELLENSIADEPPVSVREGGLIKDGYNEEIDKLRSAKEKGAQWLADFEAREKEKTGIPKMRVKYNKVFGYYLEVTKSYLNMVPDEYTRKRTLSNSECFITQELKEIENTILGADEKVVLLEYDMFSAIRQKIASHTDRILKTAKCVSAVDVLQSLGEVADKNGYTKPIVNNSGNINITNGRHPVVERVNSTEFIPNDTLLDKGDNRLSIITGPNMAGKSTYMRQVALLVLMAQIGSFVPADSAEIGVVDRIFTRVGASDDLATGQSTFMVEMTEVANILNNATSNSLLILDEIGRGTSTFDGLSIAWAVLEYIADKKRIGARTLFATHYHELTELERKIEGVNNYCVSVLDKGDDVIFLRKIIKGGTDKSYGIHVAKLAGVPKSVVHRSNEILSLLTKDNKNEPVHADDVDEVYTSKPYDQKIVAFNELSEELGDIDINSITPIEALKILYDIKEKLKSADITE